MAPCAEPTYRVVSLYGDVFGVEVTIEGDFPATVSAFDTAEAAEAWIERNRQRLSRAAFAIVRQPGMS